MADEVQRLRAVIARLERGRGKRFAPEIRSRIAAVGRQLRREGHGWRAVGLALGIPPESARRIAEAAGNESALVPVTVTPVASPLTLVSPSGWRIEGLDAPTLVALLPRLP
jgi:hypothetical protein